MRVVIAGAHGQVARRLGRLLAAAGHSVAGIVRNPDHRADLESDGVEPVVLDFEQASVDDVAAEDRILPRPGLDTTIVRPGGLTDDPGTGRVTLAHGVQRGTVPRDDVAA